MPLSRVLKKKPLRRPLTGKLVVTGYSVAIQWDTFRKPESTEYRSTLQGEGMLTYTRSKKLLGRGCGLSLYGKSSEGREQIGGF